MKCERYAEEASSTDSGNVFRSASDFSVDDKLLKAAGIVALGLAVAGCIGNGNSNGNKQEAKYEPSEKTTTAAPPTAVGNSTNETAALMVNATVATPPEILVKYEGGTAYCSLPTGANLTEDFVRECIGKDMPFYGTNAHQSEYQLLRDKVLYGTNAQTESSPENYDVRADPAFKDANFKEPFYLATGKVVEQYGDLGELDADLTSLSRGMSNLLFTKFRTGIAIDDFKSAGVAAPEAYGAKQVLDELNTHACQYLRDNKIETVNNKFFVWFLDENEWDDHVWDYGAYGGVGWSGLGVLIKVPEFVAGTPVDSSFMTHEFSHVWGLRDRTGSGDSEDLMYNNPVPLTPSYLGNAQTIAMNQNKKLNTC